MPSNFVAGAFDRMRLLSAIIATAVGIVAGAGAARSADIPPGAEGYHLHGYPLVGQRAVPFTVYDFEPGIAVRRYWEPPWAYRHYYPTGRDVRRVRAVARKPRPAQPYERYWSTDPAYGEEGVPYVLPPLPPPPLPPPPPFRPRHFGP